VSAAFRRVHVIGAGLAGLSAAVELAGQGIEVAVHEAGPAAGGRCRSYFDRELGCRVDNGNHLILSGNRATLAYLERIGARATLVGPASPAFDFVDVEGGGRWTVRPSAGRLPWWIFDPARRVPGTRWRDYLRLLALRRAVPQATVADVLGRDVLAERLLLPLAIAALNTPPEEALASLLARVVDETLLRGGQACIPLVPAVGLSETFVDPAIAWLEARGATIAAGRRASDIVVRDGRASAFRAGGETNSLASTDAIVLAVPAPVAGELLPQITTPDAFQAIVNVHFGVTPERAPPRFVGIIGGTAEWVFVKPGHVSVTISAANRLVDRPAETLAAAVWPEVCRAVGLGGAMPAWRVVKERRATIAATYAQEARRPGVRTPFANIVLAGDWTATGLPGTIEGAIRSGRAAAAEIMRRAP